MDYWFFLIALSVTLIAIGLFIWKKRIKDDDMTNEDLTACILIGCLVLAFLIPFVIDLPSAINGGQEIYVNELPVCYSFGTHISYIETDNEELKHLKLGNWNKYEKYGNYCIRYTEPIKFVLEITPID